jgi:hypothetical protein
MSRNSDEVLENKAPYNPANGSNKKTSTTGGDHTPDKKTTAPHDKINPSNNTDKSKKEVLLNENEGVTINTAKEVGDLSRIPFEALNKKQKKLLSLLKNKGDTVLIPKKNVSMNDLLQLTKHTGDEFNMFTKKGQRLIVRGYGSEIKVSQEMLDDITNGVYGKFSGHPHPPGSTINPGPADRPFLSNMNQKRSGIWGDTVNEPYIFGTLGEVDDQIIQSEIRHQKMVKYYGNL